MTDTLKRTLIAAVSEFVGTLFLTLVAMTVLPPTAAFAVGLTLLTFVYAIGGISGCHLNPAVTAGLVAARQFPLGEGVAYILAQVCGALAAKALIVLGLIGSLGSYQPGGAFAEFLGTGLLLLAVFAVTENKVTQSGSGIAIGGALMAGLLMSHGILNPAVAIAMGQATTPAVWAALLGGVMFALLFVLLKKGTPPKAP